MKINFFKCLNRKKRLERRREKLGEKFTSDWTTRKFETEKLKALNPELNFEEVEYAYIIGTCGGRDEIVEKIKGAIDNGNIDKISSFDWVGVEMEQDGLGEFPVGLVLNTYIIKLKSGQTLIQLVNTNYDCEDYLPIRVYSTLKEDFNVKDLGNRELVYPI